MNRRSSESMLGAYTPENSVPTETTTVDVLGTTINKNDIIDVANKKGRMVRYRVMEIKLNDGSPNRLILKSLDGKINTFKDITTLEKNPTSFHVLDKGERTYAALDEIRKNTIRPDLKAYAEEMEPLLDEAFDSIQNTKTKQELELEQEKAQRMVALKEKIAAILTPEQKQQVRKYAESTGQTHVLKRRGGEQFLYKEMMDAEKAQRMVALKEKIASILTPEQKLKVREYAQSTGQTTVLKRRGGEQFLYQEMMDTGKADVLTADGMTDEELAKQISEHEKYLRDTGFNEITPQDREFLSGDNEIPPPLSSQTPDTGTINDLVDITPIDVTDGQGYITKAEEKSQKIKVPEHVFSRNLAQDQKVRDAETAKQKQNGFFARIGSGIKNIFGRNKEKNLKTGASFTKKIYEPEPQDETVLPDNVIPFPKRRKNDSEESYREAAE